MLTRQTDQAKRSKGRKAETLFEYSSSLQIVSLSAAELDKLAALIADYQEHPSPYKRTKRQD